MRINGIRAIYGPNIYSYHPVLVMKLHLEELTGKESYEVPGLIDRLLSVLPGMNDHHCGVGTAGGFIERLYEGTWFGHVVEHVALELTVLAGVPIIHGKTRSAGEPGVFNVVVEFKAEKATEFLLRTAVDLVESLVRDEPNPLDEQIAEAKRIAARTELGPSTRAIVEAAKRRNVPCQRLDQASLVQLGYGKHRRLIAAAMTSQTGEIPVEIASDKDLTKCLLDRAGIPVPKGAVVHSPEEAVEVLEWLHKPVAVKPFDGRQGKGVSLNLYTPEQVTEAFRIAREYSPEVLVEELFVGRDFRVLVIDGKVAAASERIPAHVVGTGEHTVSELIEIENLNPLRGEGHSSALTKIEIDEVMTAHLQKCGLGLETVPPAGKQIFLRENANLSKGGTARDVTDDVHPSIKRICERAARVIGLDVCGIDLVLPDISGPIVKGGAGVIEVNAAPGLRMHTTPSEGEPRDVGAAVIEMLYPPGVPSRIPIVSVTGTNGKTTIVRLIARLLSSAGQTVGMTTTDGIYINDELLVEGDMTGPVSSQMILSDPAVDVAVLEVARGGIIRGGLSYDWSDVSVLSNIQMDHLGQNGINSIDDILFVKSLVAECVREGGTLILNADDERLARLAESPRVNEVPKKYVYYSLDHKNPLIRFQAEQGCTGYFLRNGWVIELADGQETHIIEAADIPSTFGGAAEYQISNVMAAVAAARACGVSIDLIAEVLAGSDSVEHNIGRGNLYSVGAGRVLVDYGHNPEAFNAVGRALEKLKGGRLTGIIGVPGDRNDVVISDAGRTAAKYFDRLIIREDEDLRGRESGETARILRRAADEAAPGIECRMVFDEKDALELAIREMEEGEIVVIFYDQLDAVRAVLERHTAVPAGIEQIVAV
jgi:cyanophycin synthetase